MKYLATISAFCLLLAASGAVAHNNTAQEPLTGTWQCIAHGAANGDLPFTLHMDQHNPKHIYGWVTAPQGTTDLRFVHCKASHLQIEIDTEQNQYALTGVIKDNQLSGTWKLNGRKKGTWQGKKTSNLEVGD